MNPTTKYLNELNIDITHGRVRAVKDAGSLALNGDQYREIINDLTGIAVDINDKEARYAFLYTVEYLANGMTPDIALSNALPKAEAFVKNRPWVFAEINHHYTPKSTVDALGKPKQKKGAKKQAAIVFWKNNQDKYDTRKQWIEALAENIGLTSAAASTYHYNLKKGVWK